MKRAALLIGQSCRGSDDFTTLLGVQNDVQEMHGLFKHVCKYDLVRSVMDVTRSDVLAELDEVLSELRAADRLLIYFAGHGHSFNGRHVLICHGARAKYLDLYEGVIPVELLRRSTDDPGLERALLIDSCCDVFITRGAPVPLSASDGLYLRNIGAEPVGSKAVKSGGSFGLLSACSEGQTTVEIRKPRQGLFTKAVVDVLTAAYQHSAGVELSAPFQAAVALRMREVATEHGLPHSDPLYSGTGSPIVLLDARAEPAIVPLPVPAPVIEPPARLGGRKSVVKVSPEPAVATATRPKSAAEKSDGMLVVAADGTGDFSKIADALAAAVPGSVIKVRPGRYAEQLLVDKPVELIGSVKDPASVTVTNMTATSLTVTAARGSIRGFAFVGKATPAVEITGGECQIENCHVVGSGLRVAGVSAQPKVTKVKIGPSQNGIAVQDGARGTFKECTVLKCSGTGISISEKSGPVFNKSQIRQCGIGIESSDDGTGLFEDCVISQSTRCGWLIKTGAAPLARRCAVVRGKADGINVRQRGRGTFENCEVSKNAGVGVLIESAGGPQWSSCVIEENKIGVRATGGIGKGVFEECRISGSKVHGVEVEAKGNPVFRKCEIRNCGGSLISVVSEGRGSWNDCDIHSVSMSAVVIKSGGDTLLRRCTVRNASRAGIRVTENGKGTFEDCDIKDNEFGIATASGGNPTVKRCVLTANNDGAQFEFAGGGLLEECDIRANRGQGVFIRDGADPVLRKCKIHDGLSAGVMVLPGGKGTFKECDIFANRLSGLAVKGGNPVVTGCHIYDGKDAGLFVLENGRGLFEHCTIEGNY